MRTTFNDILPATFNSITFSASGYNLVGDPITLGTSSTFGSGYVTVNGLFTDTLGMDVQLGGAAGSNQFFTVSGGGTLIMAGHLSGTTGSTLTKEGSGTLDLTNNNNFFTGQVKLDNNAGVVQITNANALGSSAIGTTVGATRRLQVNNVVGSINTPLILNGSGIANDGTLLNLAGDNTWSGNITLDSDSTLGSTAGNLTITGQISDLGGGYNLTKEGWGDLRSPVGGWRYPQPGRQHLPRPDHD